MAEIESDVDENSGKYGWPFTVRPVAYMLLSSFKPRPVLVTVRQTGELDAI